MNRSIQHSRSGFTLIELLVSITIISILIGMTAAAVNVTMTADRIPNTVSQVQSAIIGARDRAIRSGQTASLGSTPRRGLRFILDSQNPGLVNGVTFVGSQDDWMLGKISITASRTVTPDSDANWATFMSVTPPLVSDGARIKIPDDSSTGVWYRLTGITSSAASLTRDFSIPATVTPQSYRLELGVTQLAGEEIQQFNSNIVIDLERSRALKLTTASDDPGLIPSDWYDDTNSIYVQANMQILFSPSGNVAGPLASQGPIFLYFCTRADLDDTTTAPVDKLDPANPKSGEKFILRFTPQTGAIQAFPVDVTDIYTNSTLPPSGSSPSGPPDGFADDPFAFARK